MPRNISQADNHIDLANASFFEKCEYCTYNKPSHHPNCPIITHKKSDWLKGFNLAKNAKPIPQNTSQTVQLGWQIGQLPDQYDSVNH